MNIKIFDFDDVTPFFIQHCTCSCSRSRQDTIEKREMREQQIYGKLFLQTKCKRILFLSSIIDVNCRIDQE